MSQVKSISLKVQYLEIVFYFVHNLLDWFTWSRSLEAQENSQVAVREILKECFSVVLLKNWAYAVCCIAASKQIQWMFERRIRILKSVIKQMVRLLTSCVAVALSGAPITDREKKLLLDRERSKTDKTFFKVDLWRLW